MSASTVPPTSATSYVSSRSSSSESKAASAERMAALWAVDVGGVERRVSAVRWVFARPMCRLEVGGRRARSGVESKMLRRGGEVVGEMGGVGRGARWGIRSVVVVVVVFWELVWGL